MKKQKITNFTVFFILIFLGVSSVFAQKGPKDKFVFGPLNPIKMPKVETVELKNGLKLFLVEDHEYPTIDLRAMVHTGSVYEPASKIGLASLTAQALRTGGTTFQTGDEIDQELETMAATIETYMSRDNGYIMVSVLKEDIDKALKILTDILMNPAFAEDKIRLEKIMQSSVISRRNDEIMQIANREFGKLIYGRDNPYARHPEYATIAAVTREDIVDFYKRYFYPNNTIMAVWGDFDAKSMTSKIRNTLGKWKSAKLNIPAVPTVKYQYKYTVNLIDKPDVNQSNIMIGHIGGLRSNPDFPALNVMNSILSWDRMFKKIRTDEGLAYAVWGYYGASYQYPGIFSNGAQTKSESTVYAIDLMLKQMKRITEEEVTDDELARAKDEYLNTFVFNFDSKDKIVRRTMTYAYYNYPLDFMEKIKAKVEKVTKADVLRVAKEYLRTDKVQILVVGKKEDFDKPLSALGPVNVIDITIPSPPQPKEQ
ncbi:MAG: insulinase family protein [Candidatus Aminicenantes bacterium]|nr:insulinase family protein [Candidatus Aminicenantes bacterium]